MLRRACIAVILSSTLMKFCAASQVFMDSSLPVIEHYRSKGKVREIHADRLPDDVYKEVRELFVDL